MSRDERKHENRKALNPVRAANRARTIKDLEACVAKLRVENKALADAVAKLDSEIATLRAAQS